MRNRFFGIRNELRSLPKGAAITGAIVLGVVWLIVLSMVGSPRLLLHLLSARFAVLPTWLFLALMLALFAAGGFCIGIVLGDCRRGCDVSRYRGAFFFTVAVTLCYLWYALFFGARFFLPSVLLSSVSGVCFLLAALNFKRVFHTACLGMWLAFCVNVYLLFLSFLCFFLL